MDKTRQVRNDRRDFLNESVVVPLMFYRRGELDGVYSGYEGRCMRRPEEYFGRKPAEGFSTRETNELVGSFNRHLKEKDFTIDSFGQHIAQAYLVSDSGMPDDVKKLFSWCENE